MDGVNILNTVVQQPDDVFNNVLGLGVLTILMLALAGFCIASICIILKEKDAWGGWKDVVEIVIMLGIITAGGFGIRGCIKGIIRESKRVETIVYATIEDSVTWKELHERYDLVRVDGKIYQLRVREETGDGICEQ